MASVAQQDDETYGGGVLALRVGWAVKAPGGEFPECLVVARCGGKTQGALGGTCAAAEGGGAFVIAACVCLQRSVAQRNGKTVQRDACLARKQRAPGSD